MKTWFLAAMAALGMTAFAEHSRVVLTGDQQFAYDAAKVEAVSVASTDADAEVSVYAVRTVQSFTNAVDIVTETTTNVYLTPSRIGAYFSGLATYTNATGTTFVRKGGTDTLAWVNVTNDYYKFIYTDGSFAATNTVVGTNTVYVGGKSFDYGYIPQTPTIATNIVTTATTNITAVLKDTAVISNKIADVTCVGGYGFVTPSNAFLLGGERIVTTGMDVEGETVKADLIIVK